MNKSDIRKFADECEKDRRINDLWKEVVLKAMAVENAEYKCAISKIKREQVDEGGELEESAKRFEETKLLFIETCEKHGIAPPVFTANELAALYKK